MVHFCTVGFLSKTIDDIFVLVNMKMSRSHNLAVIYVQAHFWQIIILLIPLWHNCFTPYLCNTVITTDK